MQGIRIAAVLAGTVLGGAGALAADINVPVKALPVSGPATCTSIVDFFTTACQVSAYGVRFYGTIDVGASFESNGMPTNPLLGNNNFLQKGSHGARFLANPNGLSASNVGFQIKEPLGGGWSFIGQVETGFQPLSLQPLNGVHSVFQSIGTPLAQQSAFGDSNSQGQFYNDLGYLGFTHDTWGTLTVFRQNDMMQDALLAYDPLGLSGSFSPFGFFGSFAGGGDTQNRRDTTAIKYRVNLANWHLGAYGQFGGYKEGNGGNGGVQGNIGADFHVGPGVLSVDGVAAWKKDAVASGTGLAGLTDQFGAPLNPTMATINNQFLNDVISNNTTFMVLAKYQVDRWKFYGGYEHIEFANPSDPQTAFNDIAGDLVCMNCNGLGGLVDNGTQIVNNFYNIHKVDQIAFVGARYALTSSLDVTAAYYHEWQGDFSGGGAIVNQAAVNPTGFTCAQLSTVSSKCQGTKDTVALLFDWQFAPKWDTYIGVQYDANTGGDVNGYLEHNIFSTTGGVRFRW